jgi:hypothetical protein
VCCGVSFFLFSRGKKNTASHNNRVISETIGQRTWPIQRALKIKTTTQKKLFLFYRSSRLV